MSNVAVSANETTVRKKTTKGSSPCSMWRNWKSTCWVLQRPRSCWSFLKRSASSFCSLYCFLSATKPYKQWEDVQVDLVPFSFVGQTNGALRILAFLFWASHTDLSNPRICINIEHKKKDRMAEHWTHPLMVSKSCVICLGFFWAMASTSPCSR